MNNRPESSLQDRQMREAANQSNVNRRPQEDALAMLRPQEEAPASISQAFSEKAMLEEILLEVEANNRLLGNEPVPGR